MFCTSGWPQLQRLTQPKATPLPRVTDLCEVPEAWPAQLPETGDTLTVCFQLRGPQVVKPVWQLGFPSVHASFLPSFLQLLILGTSCLLNSSEGLL